MTNEEKAKELILSVRGAFPDLEQAMKAIDRDGAGLSFLAATEAIGVLTKIRDAAQLGIEQLKSATVNMPGLDLPDMNVLISAFEDQKT